MPITLAISDLRQLIDARLRQFFSDEDSDLMTDAVLFGELIGRSSHGILRILPGSYGATDDASGGDVSVTRRSPIAAHIEGHPGLLVAARATELLIRIASEHGMGIVTARGSRSTSGSLTYYLEQLAEHGLVTIACANTLSVVTAPGGTAPFLGTNPIALSVPTMGRPFIADMATSAMTGGEVVALGNRGADLPIGVAVDGTGAPTVDPRMVFEGGALLPFGGHKGFGLSMFIELVCGALAGSSAAPVGQGDDWGHAFIGISLDAMGDPEAIRRRAQEMVDRITAIPTVDGTPIRIPGHRSLAARDEALARGTVDVDDDSYHRLVELVESGRP